MKTIEQELKDVVETVATSNNVSLSGHLTIEQQAALESKFLALPQEVRIVIAEKFPQMRNVDLYILRQITREANGKLASNKRPVWYAVLKLNADSLLSASMELRAHATKELTKLSEEFDSKEAVGLIKKYKVSRDTTSKDAHIIEVCRIFGISAENLK